MILDIISSEGREDIMNMRKLSVTIIITFLFVCSCIGAYFTLKYNNTGAKVNVKIQSKSTPKLIPVSAAINIDNSTVINEKTKITKKINYTMGTSTTKETVESSGPDILGMDKKAASDYFGKQQFYIVDFNAKNVTLIKDINSWPPNSYIVKGEKGVVNIYYSDFNGKVALLKKADYTLDGLPNNDRLELEKGKAFESLDEIDRMFQELTS